jgi:hypothetical protein
MHMGELAGKGKMTYPQGRGWYDGEHRYALVHILQQEVRYSITDCLVGASSIEQLSYDYMLLQQYMYDNVIIVKLTSLCASWSCVSAATNELEVFIALQHITTATVHCCLQRFLSLTNVQCFV